MESVRRRQFCNEALLHFYSVCIYLQSLTEERKGAAVEVALQLHTLPVAQRRALWVKIVCDELRRARG